MVGRWGVTTAQFATLKKGTGSRANNPGINTRPKESPQADELLCRRTTGDAVHRTKGNASPGKTNRIKTMPTGLGALAEWQTYHGIGSVEALRNLSFGLTNPRLKKGGANYPKPGHTDRERKEGRPILPLNKIRPSFDIK